MTGAVDLSGLKQRAQQPAGASGGAAPAGALEVTEANLETEVLARSSQLPVVVVLWSPRSEASVQLGENLAALIGQEDFLVLVAGNVVVPAVTAVGQAVAATVEKAADAGGALAKGIGGTAKTVLYVAAAGVPLSLLAYAAIRAYRKKAN